jgi:hypothetical protein
VVLNGHAVGLADSGSRVSATVGTAVSACVTGAAVTTGTAVRATVLHPSHAIGAAVGRTLGTTVTGTAIGATITTGTAVRAAVLHARHAIGAAVRRAFGVFGACRGVTVVVHAHPNLQV